MYLEFFNLKQHPFQIAPDYRFLYLSRQHARAMAYMMYTVANHEGFAVITGEIGSGKTTLVQKFLSELNDDVVVIRINQSLLNAIEFLQTVACGLSIDSPKADKVGLQREIRHELAQVRDNGQNVLLIVDDAQNLGDPVLEEIRLLSDAENEQGNTLSVILVGQPELEHRLKHPVLRQLDQRIRLRFKLAPLSEEETDLYIQYRMRLAGWDAPPLFESDISHAVYQYTNGIPRLINILCDSVLLNAFVDEQQQLSVRLVENAAKDLDWSINPNSPPPVPDPPHVPRELPSQTSFSGDAIVPVLLVSTAQGYIDTYPIEKPLVRLGRTAHNELQLAYPTVSEFHAAIIHTGKSYYLVDLESEGKTLVGGKPISRLLLTDGMQFVISPYHFKFSIPKPPQLEQSDAIGQKETESVGRDSQTTPFVAATN